MRSLLLILLFGLTAHGQPVARRFPSDPNANAYFTATSMTSAVQRGGIYSLVIDLKGAALWSTFINGALYPAPGISSTADGINLANTSAFTITFINSPTHAVSTGVTWNGTTQVGQTGIIPNSIGMAYNSSTLIYYSGTSTAATNPQFYDMGSGNSVHGGYSLWTRRQANTAAYDAGNGDVANRISVSNSDGSGLFIGTSASSTGYLYRNGSQLATSSGLSATNVIGTYQIYVGGFNEQDDAVTYYSNKNMLFAAIAPVGLTTAQLVIISAIINRYETKFGRNTY